MVADQSFGQWGQVLGKIISLFVILYGLWLLLSGHYNPLLLTLGLLSTSLVVFIAWRMDVIDEEGVPTQLGWRVIIYWPWLVLEIIKANWDVMQRILSLKLRISPTLFTLKASQKSDIARVIYANSITLTPGTVTVDIEGDELLVHALSKPAADDLIAGGMDAKVSELEGGK